MPVVRGVDLASDIDLLPGLDRDADLLAVLAVLETDARGLAVLGHVRDLGDMHRRFRTLEPALRIPLARLDVAHHDVDAGHDDLAVLRHRLGDVTRRALVLAGQDDDATPLLHPGISHQCTSGYSELSFMISETRRVGNEGVRKCQSLWSPIHSKKTFNQ